MNVLALAWVRAVRKERKLAWLLLAACGTEVYLESRIEELRCGLRRGGWVT
jgi:hypothetical protein